MNIIINNYTRTVASLFRDAGNFSRRYAVSIADYKINWTRPEQPSELSPERSGDLGLDVGVKPTDFAKYYSESGELKDASDIVKKMFTLQFQPFKSTKYLRKVKTVDFVRRNELDRSSPEAQIAFYTSKILRLQEHVKKHPHHSTARVDLKEAIDKRRKQLKHLRTWDYKRFEWVLEKLNLIYKPLPEPPKQIARKESIRRLTEKHCDRLVQDKLNNYKGELKMLQRQFYVEKAEKLAFIREEELACGLEPTVSEKDIEEAKKKAKECQTKEM
ncbi:28S ribosomal protein S15, mitochondrial [Camponotus floridanus]|uniref:Small ribosomal subunit protein uS15m n=1 Tax=Camponotus floridanus TaxID=104421 RepID=E1ZVB3_CAMFO|nr:28S ribosomal protein S15, mitochondrial [Camponotus floridanus]